MLRAVFLGCALILPAFLTTTVQGQVDFSYVDPTEHVQTALARDYRPVCEAIASSLSPASHVFYPGESLFPSQTLLPYQSLIPNVQGLLSLKLTFLTGPTRVLKYLRAQCGPAHLRTSA